jgi:hypothetical protein
LLTYSDRELFDLTAIQQTRRFDWLDYQTQHMIQALTHNQDVFSAQIRAQTSTISDMFQEARNQQAKTRDAIVRAIGRSARTKQRRHSQKHQESFLIPSWERQPQSNNASEDDESDIHSDDSIRTKERKMARIKTDDFRKNQEQERVKAEADFKGAILQSLRFPTMYSRRLDIPDAHARTFDWIYREPMLEGTSGVTSVSGFDKVPASIGSMAKQDLANQPLCGLYMRTKELLSYWGSGAGLQIWSRWLAFSFGTAEL